MTCTCYPRSGPARRRIVIERALIVGGTVGVLLACAAWLCHLAGIL